MLKTPWNLIDKDASVWRGVTAHYMGFDPEFEYMRRMPLVYPSRIYNDLTIYLENRHGPWGNWFYKIEGRRLSEFNLLGSYADRFMNDEFHWVDTSKDLLPPLKAIQGWSWGGFAAMKDEWDKAHNES